MGIQPSLKVKESPSGSEYDGTVKVVVVPYLRLTVVLVVLEKAGGLFTKATVNVNVLHAG